MEFQVSFHLNEKVFLKDPESSELGKQLIKSAIDLIYELGFEHFTFKKLATEVSTTEATIYRYFENKHRLLLYILNWYWSYMEFLVMFRLQNVADPQVKLQIIIELLTQELPESSGTMDYNKRYLNQIIISESSKVYLVKEVKEINKSEVFKAYKDLCAKIAEVVSEYNPDYLYPRSLSSTLIEMSHFQQFFSNYLPKLTDVGGLGHKDFTARFLTDLLFKAIGK
ncbi:TetR/AcrR family transcriptional regulator [Dyadobacter sp. CY261]|uniref:TetR/AcrR family transcriptional regulator n=1 Tax=Dyadobacter sp. CY261 TaxID=2907203 RepID=UPI001F3D1A84|nr:TetR/AcrR family transcriptional regulator [Dyadobacter sp. CY261]MCF0071032.1 TetR/AcrR family transcriptional regulator [Dyadobacter sp. CY261]